MGVYTFTIDPYLTYQLIPHGTSDQPLDARARDWRDQPGTGPTGGPQQEEEEGEEAEDQEAVNDADEEDDTNEDNTNEDDYDMNSDEEDDSNNDEQAERDEDDDSEDNDDDSDAGNGSAASTPPPRCLNRESPAGYDDDLGALFVGVRESPSRNTSILTYMFLLRLLRVVRTLSLVRKLLFRLPS